MSVFFKELSEPNCLSDGRQDMLNLFYFITLTSLRSLKADASHYQYNLLPNSSKASKSCCGVLMIGSRSRLYKKQHDDQDKEKRKQDYIKGHYLKDSSKEDYRSRSFRHYQM